MKQVIFYSDAGFPFSILAAAIKTGRLPAHRFPHKRELAEVLSVCGVGKGKAELYRFEDSTGRERCLALWTNGQGDMVQRAISSFLCLHRIEDYLLVKLGHKKIPIITAGVWLAGLPWLRGTGLGLIHRGVSRIYRELVQTARQNTVH